ncbi:hypothetical protein V6N11_027224 [Hibiscus sabdariffa]|uniref:Uncharacterized protein n=1 Tax=Hibiscus sabdariffa TaxID=183260 RepID=A0ABR2PGB7_9ROSI
MSWEVSVDLANGNLEVVDRGQDRNDEQSSFFTEIQDLCSRRKFIFLAKMQDKYLSRKSNKVNCDEALYLEAKEALKLEKSLGVQIVGDEEEVVEEMSEQQM